MRLQKYMAQSGVASRRKSEKMIRDGKVRVNGKVVTELGTKVNPSNDKVEVNGKEISLEDEKIYIMLNKPTGYVTTAKDQFNRKTVVDLIKGVKERIYPVGRLDYDTSGLLLLTNDGNITYKITHPSFEIDKVYIAQVKGVPSKSKLKRMEEGLIIDGYKTSKAFVKVLRKDKESSSLKIKIHEGRNRQVRKMCEAIGHPVIKLKRIKIGKLSLGSLDIGNWRYLTDKEVNYLKDI